MASSKTKHKPIFSSYPTGKDRIWAAIPFVVFILFAYFMLAMRNGYMLRWYDEMSLFEPTGFFFRECLNYPGGMLRYAGAWLTQFMYYPSAGSIILILLWLTLAFVQCKAFDISKNSSALSLIIPLAMLASILMLDEAWLTLRTPGYIYSNTLGFLYASLMVWAFRQLQFLGKHISLVVPSIIGLTYFFAGFYALLAAGICLILILSSAIRRRSIIDIAAIFINLVIIIPTPHLYYTYWNGNTADNDFLFLKGLPELMFESFDTYLWIPFIVATVWMIVLAMAGGFRFNHRRWATIASCALMACTMIWVAASDRKSEQLRASVLMMKFMDQHNWQAINNIMMRLREQPNHTMLVVNNLANASLGLPTSDLPEFSPKAADGRHNEAFTISVFADVPINYYTGENNKSYRWCMEHTTQYGKRVFFLKYMVKNAIVNGDIALARRYNDILHRTIFHRQWAEGMDKYIENPSLIDSNEEFRAIRELKSGS